MTLPDAPPPPLPHNWILILYRELQGARLPLVASDDSPVCVEALAASEASESSVDVPSTSSSDDGSDVTDAPEDVAQFEVLVSETQGSRKDSEGVENHDCIPAGAQSTILSMIVSSFMYTLGNVIIDSSKPETLSFDSLLTMFEDAKVIFLEDVFECLGRGISVQKASQVSDQIESMVKDIVQLSESVSSSQLDVTLRDDVASYSVLVIIVDSIWEAIGGFLSETENKNLTYDEFLAKLEGTKQMITDKVFKSFYQKLLEDSEDANSIKKLLKDAMASVEASESLGMLPEVDASFKEDSEAVRASEDVKNGANDVPDSAETSESLKKSPHVVISILKDSEVTENSASDSDGFQKRNNESSVSVPEAPESLNAPEDVPKSSDVKSLIENVDVRVDEPGSYERSPDAVTSIQADSEGASSAGLEAHSKSIPIVPETPDDVVLSIIRNWSSPTLAKLSNPIPTTLECLVAYWQFSNEDDSIQINSDRDGNIHDDAEAPESSEVSPEVVTSIEMNSGRFRASENIPKSSSVQLGSESSKAALEDVPQDSEGIKDDPESSKTSPKNFNSILKKWKVAERAATQKHGIPELSYPISTRESSESVSKAPESPEDLISSGTSSDPIQMNSRVDENVAWRLEDVMNGVEAAEPSEKSPEVVHSIQKAPEEIPKGSPIQSDSESSLVNRNVIPLAEDALDREAASLSSVKCPASNLKASEVTKKSASEPHRSSSSESVTNDPECPGLLNAPEDVQEDSDVDSFEASEPSKTSPKNYGSILNKWKVGEHESSLVEGIVESCLIDEVHDDVEATEFSEKSPEVVPSIQKDQGRFSASKDIPNGTSIQLDSESVRELGDNKPPVEFVPRDQDSLNGSEDIQEESEDDESLPPLIEPVPSSEDASNSFEKFPQVVRSVQMHSGRFRASEDVSDSEGFRESEVFETDPSLVDDVPEAPLKSTEVVIPTPRIEKASEDTTGLQNPPRSISPKSPRRRIREMSQEEPNREPVLDEHSYSLASKRRLFGMQNYLEENIGIPEGEKADEDVTTNSEAVDVVEKTEHSVDTVSKASEFIESPENDSDVTSELSLSILMHAEAKNRVEDPSELSILVEESTENVTEGLESPEDVSDLAVNREDPDVLLEDADASEDVRDAASELKFLEGDESRIRSFRKSTFNPDYFTDIDACSTYLEDPNDDLPEGHGVTVCSSPDSFLCFKFERADVTETTEEAVENEPYSDVPEGFASFFDESNSEDVTKESESESESEAEEDSTDEDPETPEYPSTPDSMESPVSERSETPDEEAGDSDAPVSSEHDSEPSESPDDDPDSPDSIPHDDGWHHLHALLTEETRIFLVENLILQCQNSCQNARRSIEMIQNPNWDALRLVSSGNLASGLSENYPDPEQFLDVYARVLQFKARSLVVQSQGASRNAQRSLKLQTLLKQRQVSKGISKWTPPEDVSLELPGSIQRLQKILDEYKGHTKLQKDPEVEKLLTTFGFLADLAPQSIRIQAEILQEQSRATSLEEYITQTPSPEDRRVRSFNRNLSIDWRGTSMSDADVRQESARLNEIYKKYAGDNNEIETGATTVETPSGTLIKYLLPRQTIRDSLSRSL